MAVSRFFSATHKWVRVDEMRVLEIKIPGNKVEHDKWVSFPTGTDLLDVRYEDSWLLWRILDVNGDIISAGMYPEWMIVSVGSIA